MKRNIVTTVSFNETHITLSVVENLKTSNVELFSQTDLIENTKPFIKNALANVSTKIGAVINKVFVTVDFNNLKAGKVCQVQKNFLVNGQITNNIIKQAVENIKDENENLDYRIVLFKPFKFVVSKNDEVEIYKQEPLGKEADSLMIYASISFLNENFYNYIQDLFYELNLKVVSIFPNQFALGHSITSDSSLINEAIIVDTSFEKTSFSIFKNNSLLHVESLSTLSFNKLSDFFAKKLEIDLEEAEKLLLRYSSIKRDPSFVISWLGKEKSNLFYNLLFKIVIKFLDKVNSSFKRFINSNLPIIFLGFAAKIDGFLELAKSKLKKISSKISFYKPITFISHNMQNIFGVGIINYIQLNQNVDNDDLLIDTNPETISLLTTKLFTTKQRITLWEQITKRIGGKYGTKRI